MDARHEEREPVPFPVNRGPARMLPAWTYFDAEFLDLEMERILKPSWQIVCHESDLPDPGCYRTLDVRHESVIVVRGKDAKLRAFHNVCRHRASRLLYGTGRTRAMITCPYHGWSYDLRGELRGVPEQPSFPGLDKACLGLKPVELEVFLGFVFIRLRDDGGLGINAMWAPYREELEQYRLPEMRAITPLDAEQWECNWKIGVDNNLECYHIPIGHPGLFRMFGADYRISVEETGVSRGVSTFRDKPSAKWTERLYQERIVRAATHLPEEKRRAWLFYAMLPNLGIDVYPDSMDFFQILPLGPERCVARSCVYALPDERREMRTLRRLNWRISGKVMEEDNTLSRRVQQGVRSSGYEPGPLSEHEICLKQFHDLIRRELPVARLPAPPNGRPLEDTNNEMREAQGGPTNNGT